MTNWLWGLMTVLIKFSVAVWSELLVADVSKLVAMMMNHKTKGKLKEVWAKWGKNKYHTSRKNQEQKEIFKDLVSEATNPNDYFHDDVFFRQGTALWRFDEFLLIFLVFVNWIWFFFYESKSVAARHSLDSYGMTLAFFLLKALSNFNPR